MRSPRSPAIHSLAGSLDQSRLRLDVPGPASVYVGIDVHRKRSQVAILDTDGAQRCNRNVVTASAELVEILSELPAGTPVAFDAAYGRQQATGAARRP
jgi:hypothetical protein